MRREASPSRPRFAEEARDIGFEFAGPNGEIYWDESVRYVFTLREIEERIERAAAELQALCLALVDKVATSEAALERLRIPRRAWDLVAQSWRRRDLSLYGRFDLAYDGSGAAKLLEYNADTPTSLYEAAVVQWRWLEQGLASGALPEGADQFNSLHEKIIARWRAIGAGRTLHLACMMSETDDRGTLAYLDDCARQAGLATTALDMGDIGLRGAGFEDRSGASIDLLFKLYPWEWMLADAFGRSPAMTNTQFVEPPWKMILANKGMLALLWEMAPGHPNLLSAAIEGEPAAQRLGRYARKPLLAREGADIALVGAGDRIEGEKRGYGGEGYVRQDLCMLPDFGAYPVVGAWIVGDEPAGMGIREDRSPITSPRARFVPHLILE